MREAVNPRATSWRPRIAAFAAIVVVSLAVGARYVWKRVPRPTPAVQERQVELQGTPNSPLSRVRASAHVVFLEPRFQARARLGFAPLHDLEGGRLVTEIEADRVYAAGTTYLCLGAFVTSEGFVQEGAFVLDESLEVRRTIVIPGLPSRARVSADGRKGAVTLFVSGDAYTSAGFSTRTYVFDLAGDEPLFNLERLRTSTNGVLVSPTELNYWGVTFTADPEEFYATLKNGETVELVHGSVETQSAETKPARVECPSLSPDGKRLAFKHLPQENAFRWWPAVLDLATMQQRVLQGEPRSIDDQVEWLDEHQILYALKRPSELGGVASDVWVLDVDTDAASRLFLRDALSPSVVRP